MPFKNNNYSFITFVILLTKNDFFSGLKSKVHVIFTLLPDEDFIKGFFTSLIINYLSLNEQIEEYEFIMKFMKATQIGKFKYQFHCDTGDTGVVDVKCNDIQTFYDGYKTFHEIFHDNNNNNKKLEYYSSNQLHSLSNFYFNNISNFKLYENEQLNNKIQDLWFS